MTYPANRYPDAPDFPAATQQLALFDESWYEVVIAYITDLVETLGQNNDQSGNIMLDTNHNIEWDGVAKILHSGGCINADNQYTLTAADNTKHDIKLEDISISAWIKLPISASGGSLYDIIRKAPPGYYFTYNSTGNLLFFHMGDGGDNWTIFSAVVDLCDGAWHHVAAVIDRDNTGNCKTFIDGVESSGSTDGTIGAVGSLTNANVFQISSANYPVAGYLGDIKLYYAADGYWSDAEVLYQKNHPYDYSPGAGTLTDWWKLQDGSGTTATGDVNDLTVSDAAAWDTDAPIACLSIADLEITTAWSFGTLAVGGNIDYSNNLTMSTITVTLSGDLSVTGVIDVGNINGTGLTVSQIAEPSDPATGKSVMWLSNGTGIGDVGDLMLKINFGGTVKSTTLIDFV